MKKDYTIYLISNKKEYLDRLAHSIYPEKLEYFDGTNAKSFSKLVNTCVFQCPTEKVIMMSDKVIPTEHHIKKILKLINEGYAFVGLYRFGIFGFKKELLRTIGMLDERYIGGGYEDNDMYIRLKESNLSMYVSHEVPYEKRHSSWGNVYANPSAKFFKQKWNTTGQKFSAVLNVTRKILEEKYQYDLGLTTNDTFLPWSKSQICVGKLKNLYKLNFF